MKGQGAFVLPEERPSGLRGRRVDGLWWRIDAARPDAWVWEPFPAPRYRFDPISARFRVRYAASTQRAAARERFPERRIRRGDARLWLVELAGPVRLLDLCSERTLELV